MPQTPTFRAAGTWAFTSNNVSASSSLAPGAPAGKAVGDLLILISESRSITATAATPAGWTIVSGFPKRSATTSGGTIYMWTRIADGTSADTPTVAWSSLTSGTSGDSTGAGILAYTGVTATLDGTITVTDLASQTSSSTITGLTTALINTLVLSVAVKIVESSGQTSTTSWTERADNSTTSGTGHIVEVVELDTTTAGATGTHTVTWSGTTSARVLAVVVGFAAAANVFTDADSPSSVTSITSLEIESSIETAIVSSTTSVSGDDTYTPEFSGVMPQPQNAHLGPFTDTSGNLWVILHDGNASPNLIAFKSTDNGANWVNAAQLSSTGDYTSEDCFFDSAAQIIYVLTHRSSDKTLLVYAFDIATTTFSTLSSNTSPPVSGLDTNGQRPSNILKRSDGTFVIVYQGPTETVSATAYSRVSYVIMAADGTWGTPVQHDLGTVGNLNLKSATLGASDRVHWVYSDQSDLNAKHHSLDSTDVLDTATIVTSVPGGGARYFLLYDGTLGSLVCFNISGSLNAYRAPSTAAPTWTVDSNGFTTSGAGGADTSGFNVLIYDSGVYVIFRNNTSGALDYNTASGTTWGTEATVPSSSTFATNQVVSAGLVSGGIGIFYGVNGAIPLFVVLAVTTGTTYTESSTLTSKTTSSATEVAAYVETATVSSKASLSSSEIFASIDATVIAGRSSPSTIEEAAYVESSTITISGLSSVSATDVFTAVETSTIASRTTFSSTDIVAFLDSNTAASTSVTSYTEIAEYTDATTTPSKTVASATELHIITDSATINVTTSVSSIDNITAVYTDGSSLTSKTSVISIELFASLEISTIITRSTTETGYYFNDFSVGFGQLQDSSPFGYDPASVVSGVLHTKALGSDHGDSFVTYGAFDNTNKLDPTNCTIGIKLISHTGPGLSIFGLESSSKALFFDYDGTTLTVSVNSSTILGSVVISSPVYLRFRSDGIFVYPEYSVDGISWITLATSNPDTVYTSWVQPFLETNIPGIVDAEGIWDDFYIVNSSTIIDITEYIDSATPIVTTSLTSIEAATYVEIETIAVTTSTTFTEVVAFVDFSQVNGLSTVISQEGGYSDSDTASSNSSVSTTDVANYVDSNIINNVTTPISVDLLAAVDSSSIKSITDISATYAPVLLDSSTPESDTKTTYVEIADYVDQNTVPSLASITTQDIYGRSDSTTVESDTQILFVDTSAYVDNSTPTGQTNLTSSEQKQSGVGDTGTVSGIATPSAIEQANYVDTSTIPGTSLVLTTDLAAYVDLYSMVSRTSINIIDAVDSIDQNTPSGITGASATETTDYTDQSASPGITRVVSSDIDLYIDSGSVASSTNVNTSELSGTNYLDSITISGLSSITYIERAQYVETSSVVNGSSSAFGSENTDFADYSTPGTTTTSSATDFETFTNDEAATITSITYVGIYEIGAFLRTELSAILQSKSWLVTYTGRWTTDNIRRWKAAQLPIRFATNESDRWTLTI